MIAYSLPTKTSSIDKVQLTHFSRVIRLIPLNVVLFSRVTTSLTVGRKHQSPFAVTYGVRSACFLSYYARVGKGVVD